MHPLFILLQTSELTEGARRMAETDPHGWTLSLIAVTVVFSALVILFCLFTLVGRVSQKLDAKVSAPKAPKRIKAKSGKDAGDEIAAAIAMALEAENGGEVPVAIATALAMYLGTSTHDEESFVITIRRTGSAWDDPALRFRKKPVR